MKKVVKVYVYSKGPMGREWTWKEMDEDLGISKETLYSGEDFNNVGRDVQTILEYGFDVMVSYVRNRDTGAVL